MKNFRFFLGFIFNIFKTNKFFLIVKILLAVIQGLFPVANAILPKYLLDSILVQNNFSYFIMYAILVVCLQFFVPFIYSITEILVNKLLFKVNLQVTNKMLDDIYNINYGYYDNPETFNEFNRAFNFATDTGINTLDSFLKMIGLIITISSYAYIIAKFNLSMLIIIIGSIAINYLLMIRRTKLETLFKNEHALTWRKNNYFKNLIMNKYQAREMHFNDIFNFVKSEYNNGICKYNDKLIKKNLSVFGFNQFGAIFQGILTFFIIFSFGTLLYNKTITIGEYTVSINASMQFSTIIFSFINLISNVYKGILESENYSKFKLIINHDKLLSVNCYKKKIKYTDENLKIEFHSVSYSYFGTNTCALKNFSYKFNSGKIYAILGCNGSGKSTLIKLLLGLYNPTIGDITVNDTNMQKIDLIDFYKNLSVVSQDFQFVDGLSIEKNLNISSSKEKEKFFKLTNRYDLENIDDIEKEFSKIFNITGIELSGGEKQKLAIIRALIRNKRIMIFDEPTSAIDRANEKKFFCDLKTHKKDRLIIIITHNLNMAKYADEILIIDKGELFGCGNFEELKLKGTFRSAETI